MADDSLEVQTTMDFCPCDTAYGMKDFKLDDLTDEQKVHLCELKRERLREDQEYLNSHPEVRAIIALIMRLLLKERPKRKLHKFVAEFFTKPSTDIQDQINIYLEERNILISENSTVKLKEKLLLEAELTSEPEQKQPSLSTKSGEYEREESEENRDFEEPGDKEDFSGKEEIIERQEISENELIIEDQQYNEIQEYIEKLGASEHEEISDEEEEDVEAEEINNQEFCLSILEEVLDKCFEDDIDIATLPSINFLPLEEYRDTMVADGMSITDAPDGELDKGFEDDIDIATLPSISFLPLEEYRDTMVADGMSITDAPDGEQKASNFLDDE